MREKKEINLVVGANIKRVRERAGLTQERMSEMLGIGVKSLSAIECGAVGISLTLLKKLCMMLHVSSDALIFGEAQQNDTAELAARLSRLTPEQFKIADNMISNLLSAFWMGEE